MSEQPLLEPLPSVWRIPAYRRVWIATVVMALAGECERLAVGWVVLVKTDSVFLTALSFAVRKAPTTLIAPLAGAISDRMPRSRLLMVTALYKGVIVGLLGALTLDGSYSMAWLFALVALNGVGRPFEVSATQGLITDVVPRRLAMRALSVQSTGAKAVGALGSLAGGLAIAGFGATAPFLAGSAVFVIAAMATLTIPATPRAAHVRIDLHPRIMLQSIGALVALTSRPTVRALLLIAFVVEIFGFAFGSVMPVMARDALGVGARGLGALSLMLGLGAVVAMAGLAALGNPRRKELLLVCVTAGYGLTLVAFAASGAFAVSLVLVMGVGAMAALFDAIQWTLLQQYVPDDLRGRAIAGWVFAISFGWIGQLALGAASEAFGVQWALGGAGALVVLVGLAASRHLRER
ncbi:MAG: MFS transporter [Candidatus Poribacteria bacterium]